MTTRSRFFLPAAALAPAALLLGCDGLDTSNDDLPPPAIFDAEAADACGTAGAASLTLDLTSTVVTEGNPNVPPPRPPEYAYTVSVEGMASGLAAGDAVHGLLLDYDVDCPLLDSVPVTIAGDGSFTVVLPIGIGNDRIYDEFRVAVVAGPSAATMVCSDASDCLQFDNAGAITGPSGISNAIGVRMR